MNNFAFFLSYSAITMIPISVLYVLVKFILCQWVDGRKTLLISAALCTSLFLTLLGMTDTFQPIDVNVSVLCGAVILVIDVLKKYIAQKRLAYITIDASDTLDL